MTSGSEKQVKYANDLRRKAIELLEDEIKRLKSQVKGVEKSDYKKSWDTPEKIERGIARRIEMNEILNDNISYISEIIEKLNNFSGYAGKLIDGCNTITQAMRTYSLSRNFIFAKPLSKQLEG